MQKVYGLLIFLCCIFPETGHTQENPNTRVKNLAQELVQNLESEEEKLGAIFDWVTHNISYDLAILDIKRVSFSNNSVLAEVLNTKKGVCQHYAVLFNALCREAGIESYVVDGYSGINGRIDEKQGHNWVVVRMTDGGWYFFDPTWSAGYVDKLKFTSRPDRVWFKVAPAEMIKTHMPFDPLWQGLEEVISYTCFHKKNCKETTTAHFSYKDTLAAYQALDERAKMMAVQHRIAGLGEGSSLVAAYKAYLQQAITHLDWQDCSVMLNESVGHYNRYVNAKNQFFRKPKLSDDELKELVASFEKPLSYVQERMIILNTEPVVNGVKFKSFKDKVDELSNRFTEERRFLDRYLSTPKVLRIFMF